VTEKCKFDRNVLLMAGRPRTRRCGFRGGSGRRRGRWGRRAHRRFRTCRGLRRRVVHAAMVHVVHDVAVMDDVVHDVPPAMPYVRHVPRPARDDVRLGRFSHRRWRRRRRRRSCRRRRGLMRAGSQDGDEQGNQPKP